MVIWQEERRWGMRPRHVMIVWLRVIGWLLLASILALMGCTFKEAFSFESTVYRGPAVVASTINPFTGQSIDPTLGQIVFYGIVGVPVVTEADVSVDGKFVRTFSPGDWIPAQATLGRHVLSARVYLVQNRKRTRLIGCFNQAFEVSVHNRTAQMTSSVPEYPWDVPGYWWRVEIRSAAPCQKENPKEG